MHIILLSGGSGKRLWPLSNDVRSKQFIKIFRNEDKTESMLQRIYRQIKTVDPNSSITIATGKTQVSAIHNQLGDNVGISVEPSRRDTFPAIALASAYLHDVKKVETDEVVVVCPVDPFVEDGYFICLADMCETAKTGDKNLVLMGIEPTYPSEKYGYIKPNGNGWVFTEKPTKEKAQEYIRDGALWNGGVFAFKLSYVLSKSRELLGSSVYEELFSRYEELKKISFDYAVVEQETSIEVLRYKGTWKDLGTWNTLTEAMDCPISGKAGMSDDCENVNIINELDIPVFAMGVKNVVVAVGPDGVLVSDKDSSSYIKPYVDKIDQQIMFAEKSWGSYRVLDCGQDSLVIKVIIKAGDRMSYHSHDNREEVWTVVKGHGKAVVNEKIKSICPGDVITLPHECRHTVIADSEMELIEVQLGLDISVKDKRKYDLESIILEP